jgi:hypothetical protein
MNKRYPFFTACLCSQLLACTSISKVDFSVIHQSNQCAYTDAIIEPLHDHLTQTQLINRLMPFSESEDRNMLQADFSQHARQEKLYVIAQGSRSTSGYGFDTRSNQATLKDTILQLPIYFTRPAADMMLAQVMTSPCMVVGIDAKAKFSTIEVDNLRLKVGDEN